MTYIADIHWDEESDHWHCTDCQCKESGKRVRGLVMGAGSVDVLMERTNLALSGLLEINEFQIEYRMSRKMNIKYG